MKEQEKVKWHKKKGIRILLLCIGCFVIGGLIFSNGFGFIGEKLHFSGDGTVSVDTIKTIIKPASELVTGKYYYTNAVSDEDPITIKGLELPGTKNKYVFTYDGTISAGYDLSKAKIDVDNESKTIKISMPEMQILSSEVDESSYEFKYKSNSIFNDNELERNSETRAKLDKKMRKKASEDSGFTKMTEENAEAVLKSFLTSSGDTKGYEIDIEFEKGE